MVRRSARLAAKRAPQPPGPDRLSALPQELFLRICDYLMNYESDSLLKMSGRKLQFSHAKDLRALHITSKLLLEKTSTSICKLGFPMTESGLKPLLRMAGYPHVAHNIIHVKLLSPTEMSFYWHQTKNNCKRLTDILTECFVRLINLRKIELSGIKTQFRPNASPLNDSSKHFSWSAGSALSAIHATRICVTDLIYDEAAAGTMAPSPPNPFPPTWLSAFENIEKFRTVEHDCKCTVASISIVADADARLLSGWVRLHRANPSCNAEVEGAHNHPYGSQITASRRRAQLLQACLGRLGENRSLFQLQLASHILPR